MLGGQHPKLEWGLHDVKKLTLFRKKVCQLIQEKKLLNTAELTTWTNKTLFPELDESMWYTKRTIVLWLHKIGFQYVCYVVDSHINT